MGYGQFMPSSYKQYAVDFNGDGHINLWDPVDAIGSVANYFKAHGWVSGDQVAVQANGEAFGLETDLKTKYSVAQLAAAGLNADPAAGQSSAGEPAAPGCRNRLSVLVRAAELLHHYPLQPQHALCDGGVAAGAGGVSGACAGSVTV